MKITPLTTATAVALVLSAAAAAAQAPQKEDARPTAPQAAPQTGGSNAGESKSRAPATQGQGTVPNRQGAAQSQAEPKAKAKSGNSAQGEPRSKSTSSSAQNGDATQKGTSSKGAQKSEPAGRPSKGTADRQTDKSGGAKSSDAKSSGAKQSEKQSADTNAARKAGTAPRVQLSEQQQNQVRDTLLKQRGERVTNVNFSVSVGAAVPRSTRLSVVPAAIVAIVPEYRDYRYIVVRDDICIVDPATYVVVDVIPGRSSTADRGGTGRLSLNEEQRAFILRNVDLRAESRLGIGGISVGASVPHDAQLREFPSVVVEKLPEIRTYRYFAFENDIAIVDPREARVVLVIEGQR